MRRKLQEREASRNPIKVGVIGAGFFGCSTIGQVSRTPGIIISVISDIYKEKAIRGFVKFGRRKPREIVEVDSADAANHYIEKNLPVIATKSQVLIREKMGKRHLR